MNLIHEEIAAQRAACARRNASRRRWAAKYPERAQLATRRHHLRKLYGLSIEEYDAMLAQQSGRCALCPATEGGRGHRRRLFVDHDHATGRVRGLLCHACNVAIGKLGDTPEALSRVLAYLKGAL